MPRPMTPPPMITMRALSFTRQVPLLDRSWIEWRDLFRQASCTQPNFCNIRKTYGAVANWSWRVKSGSFDFNLFRSIEVFAAVVETRHVTQAAQMLGMTQSAASQHLKNLETALGVSLIDRNLRPIELTK